MWSLIHKEGTLIRYGEAEPWKVVAAKIGRTKPTRAVKRGEGKRQKKNDGRPPDTIKELLKAAPKERIKKAPPSKPLKPSLPSKKSQPSKSTSSELKPSSPKKSQTAHPSQTSLVSPLSQSQPTSPSQKAPLASKEPSNIFPAYPWDRNSCWLDTSLQLLYVALTKYPDDFSRIIEGLPKTSGVKEVLNSLQVRHGMDPQAITSKTLGDQRDAIRNLLKKKRAIASVTQFESLFVSSISHILRFSLTTELIELVCRIASL